LEVERTCREAREGGDEDDGGVETSRRPDVHRMDSQNNDRMEKDEEGAVHHSSIHAAAGREHLVEALVERHCPSIRVHRMVAQHGRHSSIQSEVASQGCVDKAPLGDVDDDIDEASHYQNCHAQLMPAGSRGVGGRSHCRVVDVEERRMAQGDCPCNADDRGAPSTAALAVGVLAFGCCSRHL
jgi:hypothetical protein